MPNFFLPPKVFANAGLKLLKNNLVAAKLVDSEGVDKTFKAGVGGTVYVKRPPEFTVRSGATASPQDVFEGEVAVNIDRQRGVDVQFTSVEETLNLDALLKSRVLDGAMAQIATQIDVDVMSMALEFPLAVGTAGSVVDTPAKFFAGVQRMDEMGIPQTDRVALVTPADAYGMAGTLLASAGQAGNDVAVSALKRAEVPLLGNCRPYMTQTVPNLTTGTRSATGTVNGAGQSATYANVRTNFQQTLNVSGLGANATVRRGEIFTIANVFAVNPRTKAVMPFLQQFVVLADATADGTGNAALTIANPIIISGAYQNCSAAPAAGATITWRGTASATTAAPVALHKTAIKLVSAKLVMPYSGEADYATDPETGLTVRYWRYSDGTNDVHNHRWDVFYGVTNVDRRLGVRLGG